MSTNIVELFGYDPQDQSPAARGARRETHCPFIGQPCVKQLRDSVLSGVCSLKPMRGTAVICCPIRLYAKEYAVLNNVAELAFGVGATLVPAGHVPIQKTTGKNGPTVVVFGKGWGGELSLPNRGDAGSYYVDWVLAKLDSSGDVEEFVAVEVQSIDTTGNYRDERDAYMNETAFLGKSTAGFNWENVNKRILPQLIYKGHVLRREELCKKGMFFVCPTQVYEKAMERLGGSLLQYSIQSGSLTFLWYELGQPAPAGEIRSLDMAGSFTTTVDQVATAFTSPSNLPPMGVYTKAIKRALGR
jgi:hypothetical protein